MESTDEDSPQIDGALRSRDSTQWLEAIRKELQQMSLLRGRGTPVELHVEDSPQPAGVLHHNDTFNAYRELDQT